jgi:hypothetical protein
MENKTTLENFSDLVGCTITNITGGKSDDQLIFTLENGNMYKLYHYQDCCEDVYIEDIIGELSDLLNSPILMAEVVSSNENPKDEGYGEPESFTWTFYKLATINGYVTIRWYGTSNGYYSETAYWDRVDENGTVTYFFGDN